jgi:hypothetical protein
MIMISIQGFHNRAGRGMEIAASAARAALSSTLPAAPRSAWRLRNGDDRSRANDSQRPDKFLHGRFLPHWPTIVPPALCKRESHTAPLF